RVGLCHHLPGLESKAWLILCLFPGSGLLESQTAHLDDSEGLQKVSGPSSPQVALTNISALAATLKIFQEIIFLLSWSIKIEGSDTQAIGTKDNSSRILGPGECILEYQVKMMMMGLNDVDASKLKREEKEMRNDIV
ncbi:hypothetical protein V1478_001871, partial [Vespula squamosa]